MRKPRFLVSYLPIRFTYLVAPKFKQFLLLVPCTIYIYSDHSVVLLAQELSQTLNSSWLSVHGSNAVLYSAALSEMVSEEAFASVEVLLRALAAKVLLRHSFVVRFFLDCVRRCKSVRRAHLEKIAA